MTSRISTKIIRGTPTSDGAGVALNRMIGSQKLDSLDPFLLLDEFKAHEAGNGFPSHPHRGFETVTYMLAGQVKHKDNLGHSGTIGAGGVQWMTAGKGVIHSEMPTPKNGLVHGFQLWVNLPSQDKMKAPRYHEYRADEIPKESRAGNVYVKVIAGKTSQGTLGAVKGIVTEPTYLDVTLQNQSRFIETLPSDHHAFIFVIKGKVAIINDNSDEMDKSQIVAASHIALLSQGETIEVEGLSDDSQFLLIAAKPINEPIARHGPFVMNTEAELIQAFNDYQSGRF